ncbi:MAG: CBASS cGAMP-activated phospholipase [Ahrensia sp.]
MRRILSIDGGGIKGTCPAAFLAALEEKLPKPVGSYFDLIAGTSTGGILAIGLGLGLSAKELHGLYIERGPEIFGESKDRRKVKSWMLRRFRSARSFVSAKHDETALKRILDQTLQGKRIGDAKTRLLIPAWDADLRSCYIYKTAHHERLTTDYKRLASDAAMATAAAPTYFRRHKTSDSIGLLDGGVWGNNPTGTAAIEAITLLDWPRDSLRILSLGCMDEVYMLSENPGKLSLGLGKAGFLNLFMDGQSSNSMGAAKLITGHPHEGSRIFRYSPSAPAGFFKLDDTSKIERLSGIGASMARSAFPELQQTFFSRPAEAFQPCYEIEEAA